MKKLIVCSLILFALACQKEEPALPPTPCEAENWGQVVITNQLSEGVDIFFDDVYKTTIGRNAVGSVEKVTPGSYLVEAKTASTPYSRNYDFEKCKINQVLIDP